MSRVVLQVLAIWITPHITSARLCAALQDLQLESLTWRNYDAWLDKVELGHFILKSDRFQMLSEFRLVDCIDMDDGLALSIAHRCAGLRSLSLHRSELTGRGRSWSARTACTPSTSTRIPTSRASTST